MVIYEVTLTIKKVSAGLLAKWLPDHIQEVLKSPGFQRARLYKTAPEGGRDGVIK